MEKPVGELLSQWKLYLTNISRNLMELSEQTEVKLIKLKAKDPANGYTGITKAKAAQCVECLETLWQYYAVLADTIDKANELYSKNSFLYSTEDDVREILDSASIVIETQHISINNRKLLSGENNEKKSTPQELLKYMEDSFEKLCKDTTEISQATDTVQSRLNNMKTEIAKLNSIIRKLGIANITEFDVSKVTKLERDPLQGLLELDKLVYSIEKYRASIKTLKEDYSNIVESFNKIRNSLSELKELAANSEIATIEAKKIFGITDGFQPTISREVLRSLEDWLQILENKLAEGSLKAVKVGISKLQHECSSKIDIEGENYYINSKAYNEWMDLKGEFKALLAKADALKTKGFGLKDSLDQLIEDTRNALYAKPVSLENCRKFIKEFKLSLKV